MKPATIGEYVRSMTRERILCLACRKHGISVHRFRYRDAGVREKVRKCLRQGWLTVIGRDKESTSYAITPAGREELARLRAAS